MKPLLVLLLVLAFCPAANGDAVWYIEDVDVSGRVGGYTAIAMDSNGYPHISYYDYVSGDLKYAWFDGSAWNFHTVDAENDVGQYNSIAIDSNDLPHFSYSDDTNEFTKYARHNGSEWEFRDVDVDEYVGEYTDIVLNSSGHPRISYYKRRTYRNLMHARTNLVSWTTETAASSGDVGLYTSIDLDSGGYSHISHFDSEYNNIKYTYRDASSWHTLTAPESDINFQITETSIAVAANDDIYICYRQVPVVPSSYTLICARYTGTAWAYWTVDSSSVPAIGTASSIAVDDIGSTRIHIGYHGSDALVSKALKYAVYYGDWETEVVDPSNNLGTDDVSIAIDDSDEPHVHMSYYVETSGYLRHAVRNLVPEASSLSISPSFPTDDDGLTCSYVFEDGNGDPDSSLISWYVDDVYAPAYDGVLSIPAGDCSIGQEWHFSVTPYDGYGYGDIVYSGTVRINALPVASNLRFYPASPNTTDPLGARYDYYDANGDPDHSMTYWYKDGINQPQYTNWDDVPGSATTKGEVWEFWIRPNDGIEYGEDAGSPNITIANSLPFVDILIIEPAPIAHSWEDITAEYIFTDPDYPAVDPDFSQICWYVNDVLIVTYFNESTLISTKTTAGDSVYFTVQAYDGEEYGNTKTSYEILINSPPSASNLSLTPGSPYTTDVLTAHYDFSDGDGHPDQSEIRWYRNGSHVADGLTLQASATAKGQEWYFNVRPYDGLSYGLEQTSPTVTILNSPPVAANVKLCPSQPWTENDLTAGYEFIDADNDPETETEIYWYRNDISQPAYANEQLVPASATQPGDRWYLAVQLSDGEEETEYEVSQTETITADQPENDTPGCFLSGTSILMADGSQKPIEDIVVGDHVLSFDETSGIMIPDRVSETFHHPRETAYLIVNGSIRVTPIHQVLSRDRWISIGELNTGDFITDAEGNDVDIECMIAVNELIDVYNFEVESFHTYVADGYVVHNRKPEIVQDMDLNSVLDGDLTQPPLFMSGNDVIAKDEDPPTPDTFRLFQNYPNPFNPATTIQFDLPEGVHVRLSVYNVSGELVTTIIDQHMPEGRIEAAWTARDDRGMAVSCGIYFYRLIAGDFVQTKKMVLLR